MKIAALHCNALRTRSCSCRFPPERGVIARLWRSRDLPVMDCRRIQACALIWRRAMHVTRRRGWEIPERLATPERLFLSRRGLLAGSGAAALSFAPKLAPPPRHTEPPDPTTGLYP